MKPDSQELTEEKGDERIQGHLEALGAAEMKPWEVGFITVTMTAVAFRYCFYPHNS